MKNIFSKLLLAIIFILTCLLNFSNASENYKFITAKSGLNLRKLPNLKSKLITTIPFNEKVEIIDKTKKQTTILNVSSNWYKVKYNSEIGWVFGAYLASKQFKTILSEIIGVYEYVYPYNTKTLIENHYIIIEKTNNSLMARYYGTTDDFDPAREGYFPGFYMVKLRNIVLTEHKIYFTVNIKDKKFYSKPISLEIKNSSEINSKSNKIWPVFKGINFEKHEINFVGEIKSNKIIIKHENEQRAFNRK